MSISTLIYNIGRLSLRKSNFDKTLRTISSSSHVSINFTPCLFAEPLKKKKRIDPAIIKQREERRKKKIEKQIRRLEKNARQLKPIDEMEVPLTLIDERKKRLRKVTDLTPEIMEQRALMEKAWTKYKREQFLADIKMLDRIQYSQQKALDELRKESEELYQEAIQIDHTLLPFTSKGPVETPPIENYESPDGEYLDVSRKWDE